MLAYLTILTTAVAALAGAPWWVAIVCGCLLALISIAEQSRLAARFEAIGAGSVLAMAHLSSLGNGLMAGGAAYLGGWALRMI
jgi:hypothetical protein